MNLQALLNPNGAPSPAPVPACEPRRIPSLPTSTNGQLYPQPAQSWATQSTAGGFVGTARSTENGVSFADIVGSSPPPPPTTAPGGAKSRVAGAAAWSLKAPGATPERSSTYDSVSVTGNGSARLAPGGVDGGRGGGGGEWVSTGDVVREQYEQARKEAGEFAR